MSLGNTGAGFQHTAEYQASALPWVTGSVVSTTTPVRFGFPKVTKYVKIRAQGDLRFGFTLNGVEGTNYFVIPSGSIETFDVRVSEIYLRADVDPGTFDLFAGLTLIDRSATSFLTGSTETHSESPGSGWQGVG